MLPFMNRTTSSSVGFGFDSIRATADMIAQRFLATNDRRTQLELEERFPAIARPIKSCRCFMSSILVRTIAIRLFSTWSARTDAPKPIKILFLGDNGHHQPEDRSIERKQEKRHVHNDRRRIARAGAR